MKKTLGCVAAALLCALPIAAGAQKVFAAGSFGAQGDGVTMNTRAIQAAIDAAAHHHGGGVVTLLPGHYLTGSLFVKSHVTLQLDSGVTLLGSEHLEDYPEMPTRIAGIEMTWPAALINVYAQDHAAVRGAGTIDGQGKVWWDSYWALRKLDDPKGLRWASDYDSKRPRLLQVWNSHDVRIGDGLTLRRSGFWTVQLVYSHNITVDGVVIRNNEGGYGPSTDGIDIDSSNHILVAHADIENNDDAICLKAGRDADGLRVNRPTTDVVIRDSVIREGAAGVTFGSETAGGFRNIEIYNLHTMARVPSGILFKSAPTRGGFAEDIRIHDMVMEGTPAVLRMTMNWNPNYSSAHIPAGLTNYPAYYKVLTAPVSPERGLEHVHDLHLWNITAVGAKLVFDVNGNPAAPVANVRIDNLHASAQSAGHITNATNWTFTATKLEIADGTSVALKNDKDITGLPAGSHPSDANGKAPSKYEE